MARFFVPILASFRVAIASVSFWGVQSKISTANYRALAHDFYTTYAIQRPRATMPNHSKIESDPAIRADIGATGSFSHLSTLRYASEWNTYAFAPATKISSIFIWKAQLPYILAASEANIEKPVDTCTTKPNQAQGKNRLASLETLSSRKVSPMRRKSRMEVDPTSEMIPKIWTVSIIGKSHDESRIAVAHPVC